MTLASSSATQMRYIEETVFGTTPVGNPTNLEMTGESLSYDISSESSKKIRSDRQLSDTVQVSANAGGGVNLELTYNEYDPFFEALLASTFSTFGTGGVGDVIPTSCTFDSGAGTITAGAATSGGSLWTLLAQGQWFRLAGSDGSPDGDGLYKVHESTAPTSTVITVDASTPLLVDGDAGAACTISSTRLSNGVEAARFFTLESEFSDVGQFFSYKGMMASKLSLKFASGAIVDGSIDFIGKNGVRDSVTNFPTGTGSAVASTNNGLMNAVFGVSNVLIDGAAVSGTFVKSLDLEIDAKLRAQDGIGVLGAAGIGVGTFEIKGTMEVYLNDGSLYDKAISDTPVTLEWTVQDTLGNGYAFQLQRAKLEVPKANAGAIDQDVMLSIPFTATIGAASGKMLLIDRFGAAVA